MLPLKATRFVDRVTLGRRWTLATRPLVENGGGDAYDAFIAGSAFNLRASLWRLPRLWRTWTTPPTTFVRGRDVIGGGVAHVHHRRLENSLCEFPTVHHRLGGYGFFFSLISTRAMPRGM